MAVEVELSFGQQLIEEAKRTHPWLHHPLHKDMVAGKLSRQQLREVIKQEGAFFLDTVRHTAVRLASIGSFRPSIERSPDDRMTVQPRPGGSRLPSYRR